LHGAGGPLADELPAAGHTPGIVWRGDGIVVAVPSLQMYSTGAELAIRHMTLAQARIIEHAQASSDRLSQLRVNGIPVSQYGCSYDEFGSTHRARVPITGATTAARGFGTG
jgi:hypothetical protein